MADILQTPFCKLIFCLKIGLFWLKIVLIRSWGTTAGKGRQEESWGKRNQGESSHESSNGNIFRVTGPLWGNSPVIGEFPSQRPVTRSFDVFFDLRLNKRLSKQSWDWWFETPSGSLWRHCNENNCQKSRPIQCVELDYQSGSRKQHCWKFWNPIERIVMPRYVFLYFLMAFAFF